VGCGSADGGSSLPWAAAVVFVCAVGWVGPSIWGQICWLGGKTGYGLFLRFFFLVF